MPKSIADVPVEGEFRTADQDERDQQDRRKTLFIVLDHALRHRLTAVATLDLVDALGLTVELDELVVEGTDRHRRLDMARLTQAEERAEEAGGIT